MAVMGRNLRMNVNSIVAAGKNRNTYNMSYYLTHSLSNSVRMSSITNEL